MVLSLFIHGLGGEGSHPPHRSSVVTRNRPVTDKGTREHTGDNNTTGIPLHSTLPRFDARIRAEADVARSRIVACGIARLNFSHSPAL